MTTKAHRIHVFFNANHMPYMYGAVHIVDGGEDNQWWESPFVVSKKRSDGREVVYGTVSRTLQKISLQLDRLKDFRVETQAKLAAVGITLQGNSTLPKSELEDRILDEQDDLIEDVLVALSVNIRILAELFPSKLNKRQVNVYDYNDACVDVIELREIADLLLHGRYIVIRNDFVENLISDKKFMSNKPQMGLKMNFGEYISEVAKSVDDLTVKDLITKLWGTMAALSTSSNIRDIMFLTQNLYTLGDPLVGVGSKIESGPLNTILNKIAIQHIDTLFPKDPALGDVQVDVNFVFNTPRFYLEPNLDRKQIRMSVQVNGNLQNLVMDYENFFREVLEASGDRKLYVHPPREHRGLGR